jgi:hypothetical protein
MDKMILINYDKAKYTIKEINWMQVTEKTIDGSFCEDNVQYPPVMKLKMYSNVSSGVHSLGKKSNFKKKIDLFSRKIKWKIFEKLLYSLHTSE